MNNRTYKSSVFAMLLEEPEYALDIYNALNNTAYTDTGLVEIQKLDNGILVSVRNDASFLINSFFNLYEHQSTFNPNMPLRFLIYYANMMYTYMVKKSNNLYGHRKLSLPTPIFVVFYNGLEARPAKETLRLSDSFEKKMDEYSIDASCVVYNINPGHNDEILAASRVLHGYTTFVEKVRAYQKNQTLEAAIKQAIDECIRENILTDFFKRRRKEVFHRAVLDFTFERQLELAARDYREEGLAEGRVVELISQICKKHQKGFSIPDIAEMLEEDEDLIRVIYELADESAPDYDIDAIYERYAAIQKQVISAT